MPESILVCIDSSEYSRNVNSRSITRLMGVIDFLQVYLGLKLQENPENTVGFLTMAGQICTVHESLTDDPDRIMSSLGKVTSSGDLHVVEGIKTARLALLHRGSGPGQKKILLFICSPMDLEKSSFTLISKTLRKENIGIDVINIGNPTNGIIMEDFVHGTMKDGNSTFVNVPDKENVLDYLLNAYMHKGETGLPTIPAESVDADLELALRLSLEEEQAKRNPSSTAGGENRDLSGPSAEEVDEDLELAIKLSLEYQKNQSEK